MTNTATGIVTNLPTTPGTTRKMLRKGQTVSIRLCVGGFADDGAREVLGTSYSYADVDGRWTATLEANAADGNQPGIVPAGTYYTVQEVDGVIWAFKIVPGTSPVNLYDCLIDNPVAPPVPGGVSEAELTARLGTYARLPDDPPTVGQVLVVVDIGPPVVLGWADAGGGSDLTLVDNGDGTFTVSGTPVVDNGDGTFTITDSEVTDNGDGTYSIAA